jgi:hypothetical protein
MSRLALATLFSIAACLPGTLKADDADPIRAELTKAKKAHAEAEAKAKAALLGAIDDAVKAVAASGDLEGVKAIQTEKKALEESGKVPSSLRLRTAAAEFQKATRTADAALEKVYDKAIKDATKAMHFDLAEAVQAELKEFRSRGAMKSPDKGSAAQRRTEVATKDDLKRFLSGTEWLWPDSGENAIIKFKADGYVGNVDWENRGFLMKWEAIDRRTVLLFIEKGRPHNRYAIYCFSEDLTEFTGYDFETFERFKPVKRKK